MKKILTALVAGTFAVSLFAADSTTTATGADNQKMRGPVTLADSVKQKAFGDWQKNLPDSIKAKIEEHQKAVDAIKTQFEQVKQDFRARLDSEKVAWQIKLDSCKVVIPDSLKDLVDKGQLPDSIKAKIDSLKAIKQARNDSLKTIITERRANARQCVDSALAKLDSEKKAKYEKALAQIDKKLADRQVKAEEAQKKLEEKKAKIVEKITKETENSDTTSK
jgi:flagellar biosynthesis chaperone FliJ